jgi:hypothetical protein
MYLALTDGYRLRVLENRVLRRISGTGREELTGDWKTCTMTSDMICNLR